MINYDVQQSRFTIETHTVVMYALFAISCINKYFLLAWLILMPFLMILKYGREGAVESLIFLQFRSLLSTGVAVAFEGTEGMVKWAVLFLISFYILFGFTRTEHREILDVIKWDMIFAAVSIISAWITSSYPITASFKVISYCIPFIAIIYGVSETSEVDWIRKSNQLLGILVIGSLVLLRNPIGFLRNGRSFQGVFNHPNVYAILIALFIAGYLYQKKTISIGNVPIILLAAYLIYQTRSRTGMISMMLIVLIFLATQKLPAVSKMILLFGVILFFTVLLSLNGSLLEAVEQYLYKGNQTSILASRTSQITNNITRFQNRPLLGTGFNVPWSSGKRVYSLLFDLTTENGNLLMALLGDVGILGTILFLITYFKMFLIGKGEVLTIYFAPFLVCMGEMSFFSTNNFAIVLYLYFAIFISDGCKHKAEQIYGEQG